LPAAVLKHLREERRIRLHVEVFERDALVFESLTGRRRAWSARVAKNDHSRSRKHDQPFAGRTLPALGPLGDCSTS
jgi:hypothetical protein